MSGLALSVERDKKIEEVVLSNPPETLEQLYQLLLIDPSRYKILLADSTPLESIDKVEQGIRLKIQNIEGDKHLIDPSCVRQLSEEKQEAEAGSTETSETNEIVSTNNTSEGYCIEYGLTAEEKQKYKDKFKSADDDEDGFVNLYDLDKLFNDFTLEEPIKRHIWKLIDRRGDERLDEEGYVLALYAMATVSLSEKKTSMPTLSVDFWEKVEGERTNRGYQRGRTMSHQEEEEMEAMRNSRIRRGAFYNEGKEEANKDTKIEDALNLHSLSSSGVSRPSKKPRFITEGKVRADSSRYRIAYADTIGKRPTMEDNLVIIGHFRGNADEEFVGVYDGHGGSEASHFAAQRLHEAVEEELNNSGSAKRSLKAAYLTTNEKMKEAGIRGGTTAISALFLGNKFYVANAGDCRAVVSTQGKAVRCSTDHKPGLASEYSRITKMGGKITTAVDRWGNVLARVCGVLSVARALGDFSLQPYVTPEPEVIGPILLDSEKKVEFLIMACDGVWDRVGDQEAVDLIANLYDPEKAAKTLRDYALSRGSEDNITAVVMRFPPFPKEAVELPEVTETDKKESLSRSPSSPASPRGKNNVTKSPSKVKEPKTSS
ncbi:hypothetical protein PROFUN_12112 [Planoprotostelium fungivorum]|uniref:PPM-type phosphatase domain-containing protein n=1 Tax=Planoprotostelium fungivorum TaxID=1890364 RepID=A0A2P6N8D7_9EUKA|nr:hypothetical protein PROFUN_12112 [Planoprotostelium fungivorum]